MTQQTVEEQLANILNRISSIEESISGINEAVNGRAQTFKLYKGVGGKNGAIQFDLVPLHKNRLSARGAMKDVGVIFVEAAKAIGNNQYDWENKIKMALGLADIAFLLQIFRQPPPPGSNPPAIYHDSKKGIPGEENKFTTKMILQRGKTNGFFLSMKRTENGQERFVSLPLSDGEAIELRTLLERAVIRIIGW